jgi:hypothetical protein
LAVAFAFGDQISRSADLVAAEAVLPKGTAADPRVGSARYRFSNLRTVMIVDMNEWPDLGSLTWVANVRHWVLMAQTLPSPHRPAEVSEIRVLD